MFNNIGFIVRSYWSGSFDEISSFLIEYFDKRKAYCLERVDDEAFYVKSDLPLVFCARKSDTIEIVVGDANEYSDINLVSQLLFCINNLFNKNSKGIKLTGLYVDYNFSSLSLDEAVKILKLSYAWQKYNFAFSGLSADSSEFLPLSTEVVTKLKSMRYILTREDAKLIWLLHVQNPLIDLSPYMLSEEPKIFVYVGTDMSMLSTLIRYYYYFFKFAFTYNSYIYEGFVKDELNAFRIKLRNISGKSEDCKLMRRKLYSKLR